jgi:RNA polymerase sigma factor (sigma-70 family)
MAVRATTDVADSPLARPAPFDFDTVFFAHYPRITRAIARIIGEPARAEELAVDAFWKLWRTPQAQGEAAPGWLHRTAIRLALDELRRRARRARYERLLQFGSPQTPDDLFSATEEQGRVRRVLAALRPQQAEMLLLRSDGFQYDEVARALSINAASVGTLLSRAREAFRKEYVKRYGDH